MTFGSTGLLVIAVLALDGHSVFRGARPGDGIGGR